MFYDLVLLIPLFFLWSQLSRTRILLHTAIGIYFSALILPPISEAINFPIMGFMPLLLLFAMGIDLKGSPNIPRDSIAAPE
jgi:hypothetical protein